jgi:predicted amino acid dehydrogenase
MYSVLPLLTQLVGLENPLFGSGKSPYSVISILPKIKDRSAIEWDLELPLEVRRALIDEVYDMIAPILLNEQEAYIDLLIDTVYHEVFRDGSIPSEEFRQIQRQKFAMLTPLVEGLRAAAPGSFAHIAHYDTASDLRREHAFFNTMPEGLAEEWTRRSFPTVVELNFRGFQGAPEIRGWVFMINNSTEQLMNSGKLRTYKILQCARLAQKLGAQTVGMAGLVAFFGKGGYYLSEQFPEIGFTTGHAYTIANIQAIAQASASKVGLSLSEATVAIVGAAGSIGSGCASLFATLGVPRLVLIDTLWQEPLQAVAERVRAINGRIQVTLTNRLEAMREADLSVVATNSPRTIIEPEFLKLGSIVIDDSFPKNVPQSMARTRTDVILLEGGAARLPSDLEVDRARNLPNILDVPFTRMVSCQEIYGCFAETLTLAASGHQGNYGLGPADPGLAADILARARKLGIGMAPLQFYGGAVSQRQFERVSEVRRQTETEQFCKS